MVMAAMVTIVTRLGGLQSLFDLQQWYRGLLSHDGMLGFDAHQRGRLRNGDQVVMYSGSTVTWVPPEKVARIHGSLVSHFWGNPPQRPLVFAIVRLWG